MHTDKNDRSSSFFLSCMEQAFAEHRKQDTCLQSPSPSYDEILHYLQRYRDANGNTFDNKNTICCWSVVSEPPVQILPTEIDEAEISFEHHFCCENLFFALDISSRVLKHESVRGKYGGSLLTRLITHGSSLPVCQMWELDEKIGVALYPDDRGRDIPFAWGRSGGKKKAK
jgi:hypothetical protein